MTVIAEGREQVDGFRMLSIYHGIKLYLSTGMKPSRMWTPRAMREAASQITGKKYARSLKGLEAARDDLGVKLDALKKGK